MINNSVLRMKHHTPGYRFAALSTALTIEGWMNVYAVGAKGKFPVGNSRFNRMQTILLDTIHARCNQFELLLLFSSSSLPLVFASSYPLLFIPLLLLSSFSSCFCLFLPPSFYSPPPTLLLFLLFLSLPTLFFLLSSSYSSSSLPHM